MISRSLRILGAVATASSLFLPTTSPAQPPAGPPRTAAPPAAAPPATTPPQATAPPAKAPKIPEPEDITLETTDRVLLHATWFPGSLEKRSVPIILLHDGRGNRSQMLDLAKYLQQQGHAALALDLRGYGASTGASIDPTVKLDHEKFRANDWAAIVTEDLEAAKRFLMQKNNAGELNIEMLCIIAAGESTVAAVNWAARDWSWPDLLNKKQGKDVKALVLLSPERKWESLNCGPALTHPSMSFMSFLIAVGADSRLPAQEAGRVHGQLQKSHRTAADAGGDDSRKSLILIESPTKVQGAQLIDPRLRLGIERDISKFIAEKLAANINIYAWTDRSKTQ